MSDIHPSEYYDVVGEHVRRADSEKMWLRRGIQLGRDEDAVEAKRRVEGFTGVTTAEREFLEHGVRVGQVSRGEYVSEERVEQIYRERTNSVQRNSALQPDLPSGRRIWELAEKAIQIEKSANRSRGLSYELYEAQVNAQADKEMGAMDPGDKRFFESCLAGVYVPPEQRRQDWKSEYEPAYFVTLEPIQGDTISYGPFGLEEARERFEVTYPEFDGGSVALLKVESSIPGVSPSQLRTNALSEEYAQGDPEEERWFNLYDKSRTVVGRDVWESRWDHGEVYWSHKGKEYDVDFMIDLENKRHESERDEIETIHESEWHQGFGSECKEHLGQDKNGYYYALERESDDDLSWSGPYNTREEAEERLSEAYDRWDDRTGQREQAWEDHEIARLEKEEQREIERECDRQSEREIERQEFGPSGPERRTYDQSRLPFQPDSMEGPELEKDITGWTGRSYNNMDELREGEIEMEI